MIRQKIQKGEKKASKQTPVMQCFNTAPHTKSWVYSFTHQNPSRKEVFPSFQSQLAKLDDLPMPQMSIRLGSRGLGDHRPHLRQPLADGPPPPEVMWSAWQCVLRTYRKVRPRSWNPWEKWGRKTGFVMGRLVDKREVENSGEVFLLIFGEIETNVRNRKIWIW